MPATIDEYISGFPDAIAQRLTDVRRAVADALPDATEAISYGIPTVSIHGTSVVHFAAWSRHLSLYPVPVAEGELAAAIDRYRAGKALCDFCTASHYRSI